MNANAPQLRLNPLASAIAFVLTGTSSLLFVRHVQAQDRVEEITVTGSRIQRDTSFTTAVPVTAVTTSDLASFKPGATMADQLDQLPQFFQTQSAQRGGGALFGGAGRSVIDLRSMGPQRTLVLLDGARCRRPTATAASTSTTSRRRCCRKSKSSPAAHPPPTARTRSPA